MIQAPELNGHFHDHQWEKNDIGRWRPLCDLCGLAGHHDIKLAHSAGLLRIHRNLDTGNGGRFLEQAGVAECPEGRMVLQGLRSATIGGGPGPSSLIGVRSLFLSSAPGEEVGVIRA